MGTSVYLLASPPTPQLSRTKPTTQLWSTALDPKIQSTGTSSGHNIYNPKSSSTWKKILGSSWKIKYGDNSNASGIVGTDNLTLGGLRIDNQAIQLASKLSPQLTQGAADGLLGLAFGRINTVKPKAVKTAVENMIEQEDIDNGEQLFTCYLGSWRDADEDCGGGFFTFGYIDEQIVRRCGREVHYVPVDPSKGFWQFKSESATVNGRVVGRVANTVIVDTGTTLALVSDRLCEAIYGAVPGAVFDARQHGWVFPVDTPVNALPRVTLAVGDQQFEIQREDFGFAGCGGGMQYGGIQSRGDSEFDILGHAWLKGVYVVFDQGRKRLGVVQRVEKEQIVSAPK